MELLFDCGQAATATPLTANGAGEPFETRLLGKADKRLTIGGPVPAALGSVLRAEWSRYIVMGEIVDIRQDGSVVLHIRHALTIDDINSIRERWS